MTSRAITMVIGFLNSTKDILNTISWQLLAFLIYVEREKKCKFANALKN